MARAVYGGSGKQKTSVLAGRYTQGSNPAQSGVPQGSPGGLGGTTFRVRPKPVGGRPGMRFRIGDEGFIWILVAVEVLLMIWLRQANRRHHGG